jgi:hypothetical protein
MAFFLFAICTYNNFRDVPAVDGIRIGVGVFAAANAHVI